MSREGEDDQRSIGLVGATAVGVGAIVGGGVLALAGVAFAATGPGAIVAFTLNGVIAWLTAMSFAEMASVFPQSGGTYTFSKKVLTVEAAFAVGWVVWFASIVAAMLYALGFSHFAAVVIDELWSAWAGSSPPWITGRFITTLLAVAATGFYTFSLISRKSGGGQWINFGKVAVFAVLIAAGLWALTGRSSHEVGANLKPFFPGGSLGLFQAMGFTFIALQGFDLIAAVGGEVREPQRNIPRAMFYSLGIALAIYLPLLFVIATVGVAPGESIASASRANPETIVAVAAQNYLGRFGYWLVMVAAILSMLSALQANLFAASRVALAMARDHTLPNFLSEIHPRLATPSRAILMTAAIVVLTLLLVPDVAAAGAAASLIFLITFALAHWISILIRRRTVAPVAGNLFRSPLFPAVPLIGALLCIALAVFQGIAVPSAGFIAAVWLILGGALFLSLFAHRARVADASSEAFDPEMARLRGRSPLVLVPIANPSNAEAMVAVANALAPRDVGRVMLLSIVVAPVGWRPDQNPERLADVQSVLGQALAASLAADVSPEALTTIAADPWAEILRVARLHRCESVLLGLTKLEGETIAGNGVSTASNSSLDGLLGGLDCDVVILRARGGLDLASARRILVPVGGGRGHDKLRARMLGSLARIGQREITFLRVLPQNTAPGEEARARRELLRFARDETRGHGVAKVVLRDSVIETVLEEAADSDLVILGSRRLDRRRKLLGNFTLDVARGTNCPLIIMSRRG